MEESGGAFLIVLELRATSQIPFSTITLIIDKSNYSLKQLDLYYSSQEDFSTNFKEKDLHQPHLQIKFSDIEFNPNKNTDLLRRSTYLKIENSVLTTTDKYEGYKLIDYRLK